MADAARSFARAPRSAYPARFRLSPRVGIVVSSLSRSVLATLLAVLPSLAALAQEAAPQVAPAECRAFRKDAERLACYDRLFGAPEESLVEQTTVPPSEAVTFEKETSLIDQRWELSPGQKQGTFKVSPYEPVYILAAFHASSMNDNPSSPSEGHTVPLPLDLTKTETKFQISLKSKLWENVIGNYSDLWFAYTQSSRWQLFNATESRPFRETDYQPELMLTFRTHYRLFGWEGRLAGVNLTHESNGRAVPLSRSWNRIVGQVGIDRPGWSVMLRPWVRLHEDRSTDDNPDIEDYMGRADLVITRNWRGHELSTMFRHSLRTGSRSHGAFELNWAFPIHGELKGYLQYFSGYGESLIDYNHSANYVGLGVSLVEWYSHTAETTRD
jgi:phospholipase A1/A2